MALSFSIAAPLGLSPVALAVLLGPDPLVNVPADSLLAIMIPTGLFMPAPNALAGVALPLSILEGAFGGALHLRAGPGMVAGRSTAATAVALPKWDELVAQLITDGLPAVAYETLGVLAAAVSRIVDALDEDNLPPAYELLGVDIYPLEPVPPLAPAMDLVYRPLLAGLCYSSFRDSRGFLRDLGAAWFIGFGRHLSMFRDFPGAPYYDMVTTMSTLAATLNLAPAEAVCGWLAATRLPTYLTKLESGPATLGARRRAALVYERWHLSGLGTPSRRRTLLAEFLATAAARRSHPQIAGLVKQEPPVNVLALCDDLIREITGTANARIEDTSHLDQLQRALAAPRLLGILEQPAFLLASAAPRAIADAVIEAVRLDRAHERRRRGAAGGGASGFDGGLLDAADDQLASALRTLKWYTCRAKVEAVLDAAPVDHAALIELLVNAPVLEVRRLTLACNLRALATRDKVLERAAALVTAENYRKAVSLALLADHLGVPLAQIPLGERVFRLEEDVVRKLRALKFSAVDWVNDFSAAAERHAERPHGPGVIARPYLDSVALDGLALRSRVLCRFLGLPADPPRTAGGAVVANWFSLPMLFAEQRAITGPLRRRDDAAGRDEQEAAQAFLLMALRDAETSLAEVYSASDPDGPLPSSILQPDSPSIGVLMQLRDMTAESLKRQRLYPRETRLLGLMERLVDGRGSPGGPRRADEARDDGRRRDRAGDVDAERLARARDRVADRDRGASRSGSRERADAPGRASSRSPVPDRKLADDPNDPRVRDTDDGTGFVFLDRNGKAVGQVWSYALLEARSGRTRADLDFAVICSCLRDPAVRLRKCRWRSLPGHLHATDAAHVAPAGFEDAIKAQPQDFAAPAGQGAPPSALSPSSLKPHK